MRWRKPPIHVELVEDRTPALGARLVARAWVDAGFKERLLSDAAVSVNRRSASLSTAFT